MTQLPGSEIKTGHKKYYGQKLPQTNEDEAENTES